LAFTGFDRGPGEDNPPDALSHQRVHGGSDREIRLPRASRTDPHDDVVLDDELEVLGLTRSLWLNDAPDARQHDALAALCAVARRLERHAQHVIRVQRHPLPRGVDHALGNGRRTVDRVRRAGYGQDVAA
jgi:hypothetical protein